MEPVSPSVRPRIAPPACSTCWSKPSLDFEGSPENLITMPVVINHRDYDSPLNFQEFTSTVMSPERLSCLQFCFPCWICWSVVWSDSWWPRPKIYCCDTPASQPALVFIIVYHCLSLLLLFIIVRGCQSPFPWVCLTLGHCFTPLRGPACCMNGLLLILKHFEDSEDMRIWGYEGMRIWG